MTALQLLAHGDGVSRAVAALLAAMSVASWVTILWKAWLLRGGTRAVLRGIAAFWQAPTLADAERGLAAFDASRWRCASSPRARSDRRWMSIRRAWAWPVVTMPA